MFVLMCLFMFWITVSQRCSIQFYTNQKLQIIVLSWVCEFITFYSKFMLQFYVELPPYLKIIILRCAVIVCTKCHWFTVNLDALIGNGLSSEIHITDIQVLKISIPSFKTMPPHPCWTGSSTVNILLVFVSLCDFGFMLILLNETTRPWNVMCSVNCNRSIVVWKDKTL